MPPGNAAHQQLTSLVIQAAPSFQTHITALAALRRSQILDNHVVTDRGKGIAGINGCIHNKRAAVIGPLELVAKVHGQHGKHGARLLPAGNGNDRAVFRVLCVFIVVEQGIPGVPGVGVQPH